MANDTINNGQTQRKQLSGQLDRLDQILDGLDAALSESIATAVTDVVGQVVKEAVETTIREVLGNPELLRATLAQHTPPKPQRRTLKDLLASAGSWVVEKAKQAASKVSDAWSWCREKVQLGFSWVADQFNRVTSVCQDCLATLCMIALYLWEFRRTSAIAVGIGVVTGLASYFAGPVIVSIASGISGAALTVSGMILVPLWRLMTGGND